MLDLGKGCLGKFSIPSNKCLLLISIYTAPAEWVGLKHIDIVVALHRCRLTLRGVANGKIRDSPSRRDPS